MATPQENQLEAALVDKGLTAERVTPSHIDSIIVARHFFTAGEGVIGSMICNAVAEGEDAALPPNAAELVEPISRTTFCLLTLANGAQVSGVNYCPISMENWDAETGRELAERDARNKIWELEGYALRQRRYQEQIERDDIAGALADFDADGCEGCKL